MGLVAPQERQGFLISVKQTEVGCHGSENAVGRHRGDEGHEDVLSWRVDHGQGSLHIRIESEGQLLAHHARSTQDVLVDT